MYIIENFEFNKLNIQPATGSKTHSPCALLNKVITIATNRTARRMRLQSLKSMVRSAGHRC